MKFNTSAKMIDEDFYAEYLGKKSEMPYEYRISNQYSAKCPISKLPQTAACKGFGVGPKRVDASSSLRPGSTHLNAIHRANTSTVLYGTAPYKFGYDINDPQNVTNETMVLYPMTTFGPQRIITEQQYDRNAYLDQPTVVEPFDKKGLGTRFDTVELVSATSHIRRR